MVCLNEMLCIVSIVAVCLKAQGVEDGDGGHDNGGSSFNSLYDSSDQTESRGHRSKTWIASTSTIVICIVIFGFIGVIQCLLHRRRSRRQDNGQQNSAWKAFGGFISRNNAENEAPEGETEPEAFVNGWYSGYYQQNEIKYVMPPFRLSFEDSVVSGSGCDCIGEYRINGTYSDTTRTMAICKKYIFGTGYSPKNRGHTVLVELAWNTRECRFEGVWHIDFPTYAGSGRWCIERCDGESHTVSHLTRTGNDPYV